MARSELRGVYSKEAACVRRASYDERLLAMCASNSERKGLLWWVERENTNEAWSVRNPWLVTGATVTAVIVLCIVVSMF